MMLVIRKPMGTPPALPAHTHIVNLLQLTLPQMLGIPLPPRELE